MLKLKLIRKAANSLGTKGILEVPGLTTHLFTIENPWLDNKKTDSCIPTGTYICKPVNSPRFGKTIEVTSVPNRSHILFHAGNSPDDTDGCILLGLNDTKGDRMWISNSKAAVIDFLNAVGRAPFELEIVDETSS